MSLISHLLCAWFAFLLPCYSTFKALSNRSGSESDLERLAMYWAVIGIFVAFESSTGWLLSWLPFYWEIRTLFLLYLSLPQTQGSTYVYKSFLEPFCAKNEADLDAGIDSAQSNVLGFCQARISNLIEIFWSIVNKTPITKEQLYGGEGQPSVYSRAGLSVDSLKGMWDAYGPAVFGGLTKSSAQPRSVSPREHTPSGAEVNNGSNGYLGARAQDVPADPALSGSAESSN